MITYKQQWWTVHERRGGRWVKRVKVDVGEPTQRQLLIDIVRPMTYSRTTSRKTVKEAKRCLRKENSLGAVSVVQQKREPAINVTTAKPERPPVPA